MNDLREMCCTWPNGEQRLVTVVAGDAANASVIWNERVDTSCAAVTGFQDIVPSAWLSEQTPKAPNP